MKINQANGLAVESVVSPQELRTEAWRLFTILGPLELDSEEYEKMACITLGWRKQ